MGYCGFGDCNLTQWSTCNCFFRIFQTFLDVKPWCGNGATSKGLPRETRCKKRINRQEVASDSKVHIVEKTSDRCRWFWILSTVRQTKTSKSDQSLGWSYEIMCIIHQVSKINMHQKKVLQWSIDKKNIKHIKTSWFYGWCSIRPAMLLPTHPIAAGSLSRSTPGGHWMSLAVFMWAPSPATWEAAATSRFRNTSELLVIAKTINKVWCLIALYYYYITLYYYIALMSAAPGLLCSQLEWNGGTANNKYVQRLLLQHNDIIYVAHFSWL